MMSLEALVGLTVMLFILSFLLITFNANRLDTTLYEYQLLNDIIEVGEKQDFFFNASHGDYSGFKTMIGYADALDYCLNISTDPPDPSIPPTNCPNSPDGWTNVVSTVRTLIRDDKTKVTVRFVMWKKTL